MDIKKRNEKISKAILVSKLMDAEGFDVVREFFNEKRKEFRFQDILGIKNLEALNTQQGMALMIDTFEQWFDEQRQLALKPMIDENTGEEEILNINKQEEIYE